MSKKDTLIFSKMVTQGDKKVPFECQQIGGILVWTLETNEIYKCPIFSLLRSKARFAVNDILRTRLQNSGVDSLEIEKILKGGKEIC